MLKHYSAMPRHGGGSFAPGAPPLMMAAYVPAPQATPFYQAPMGNYVMPPGSMRNPDGRASVLRPPPGEFSTAPARVPVPKRSRGQRPPAGRSDGGSSAGGLLPIPLVDNVRRLSRTYDGCREVQSALERAVTDDDRAAIADELRGHVLEACKCMNANHVIQKCVVASRPQSSQFIIDELVALGPSVGKVAKHKYGCRVLQRLLEHCQPGQMEVLVEGLISDSVALSRHLYGTYVVQCILEHGTPDQRRRLVSMLAEHAPILGADIHGAAVLSAALSHGNDEGRITLAKALVPHRELLARMARTRRGHAAVISVLELLDTPESAEALMYLAKERGSLQACRYGKVVASRLPKT